MMKLSSPASALGAILFASHGNILLGSAYDYGHYPWNKPTNPTDPTEPFDCSVEDCSAWGEPLTPTFEQYRDFCCPPLGSPGEAEGLTRECCFITPPLTRITADEAFDAYQRQTIGGKTGVILVDVRDPEEVYWTGQPAQTNNINLKDGQTLTPEFYKTILHPGADPELQFHWGMARVDDVSSLDLSPISFNVPIEFLSEESNFEPVLNPGIGSGILDLIDEFQAEVAIYYCRSGRRSSIGCYWGYCKDLVVTLASLDNYEIEAFDDVNNVEINGIGGFQGSSYSGRYNGYRGFPDRLTPDDAVDAASWMDAGLPIAIAIPPMTLDTYRDVFELPFACREDPNVSPVCKAAVQIPSPEDHKDDTPKLQGYGH